MEFRYIEPATDFTHGLRVLYAYHDSLLQQGERLLALSRAIGKQGMDEELAHQSVQLHVYYTRANFLHHQDEERALFPLVINRSSLIDGMIERLGLDHEEIEAAWRALAVELSAPERIDNPRRLLDLAVEFELLQRRHLIRENEDFFPQVAKRLTPAQCAQMGRFMARMRGF